MNKYNLKLIDSVRDEPSTNSMAITTNFLDDISDSIGIYYDKTKREFTDNGYTAFEFNTHNLNLNNYQKSLSRLLRGNAKYDAKTHEIILKAELNDENLAEFIQSLIRIYTYLDILTDQNNFLISLKQKAKIMETELIKITKHNNILNIKTNFLDIRDNLITFSYDQDKGCFTDNGQISAIFIFNLKTSQYANQIKALLTCNLQLNNNCITWHKPLTRDNLTIFLQNILSIYTYLRILTNEDDFI